MMPVQTCSGHSSIRLWQHSRVKSCPVHLAALAPRPRSKTKLGRHVLPTRLGNRRTLTAYAVSAQKTERDKEPQAWELVRSLRQELRFSSERQLSSARSVHIYRLGTLCNNGKRAEVWKALLQDHELHQGNGILVAVTNMLANDDPCQALAANFLTALLDELPQASISAEEDSLPEDWQLLATPVAALPINDLLELVVISTDQKVKAAAALLLLLVVMSDEPARRQAAELGTATIVYAQLLQAALTVSSQLDSKAATSDLLRAVQLDAEMNTQLKSALLRKMEVSIPFLAATKALAVRLCGSGVSFVMRMQSLSTYTACTAISQCKWTPTAASVPQPPQNIFLRATSWLRKQSKFDSSTEKVQFGILRASSIARMGLFDDESLDSEDELLLLAEELQLCLKQAEGFVAKTQAQASASAVDSLEACLKRSATPMEQHTMAGSLLPYLVDMLQHPSAGSRGAAAGHLARIAPYASETVATALLQSPDDCLGALLKYLASEDSLRHRAQYALLIGTCAQEADSAVMKKISDAGAAPYLLALLKQADTNEVKGKTLTGLAACARESPEMSTSIAVHGGVSLLLELLKSAVQQAEVHDLQADDEAIICATCCIFDSIIRRRESSMDQQLLAELPALLMCAISSCAHEPRLMLEALHCLDSLRGVSDSAKQQVLHSLTPANTEAFLDGILSLLEDEERLDPNFIEGVSDTQDLTVMILNSPTGRQVVTQPAMLTRIGHLWVEGPSHSVRECMLPICALLTRLREDGSSGTTPWLAQVPRTADIEDITLAIFKRSPPQQPTQLHSAQEAQALMTAAADRVIQRSLARIKTSDKPKPEGSDASNVDSGKDKTPDSGKETSESSTVPEMNLDVQTLLAVAAEQVSQRGSDASSSSGLSSSANFASNPQERSDSAGSTASETDSPASEILNIACRSSNSVTSTSAMDTQEASNSRESGASDSASNADRRKPGSSSSETSTSESSGQDRNDPPLVSLQGLSGKDLHDALVQTAALLMLEADSPMTQGRAAMWLSTLSPALSDSACQELASSSGAVQASLQLIRQEQDLAAFPHALAFCLRLHHRGMLPIGLLLEAQAHKVLPKIMVAAAELGDEDGLQAMSLAGCLLFVLWQQQPSLIADFAAAKQTAALLKLMAHHNSPSHARLVCTALVHQVWMHTASLVSEPLLVQAIPELVRNCVAYDPQAVASEQRKLMEDQLQEESIALLCTMADFAFYRPSIRDAQPTEALADMIHAGCSQSDNYQHRQMAQAAINLIYKLMKGQRDGSDGLDARHNIQFFTAVGMNELIQPSIVNMCKRGTTESRHGALAALQLILSGCAYHKVNDMQSSELQISMISHGLVPMLFDILIAPDSTAEMRKMAQGCVDSIDVQHNTFAAKLGRHCLLAKLTAGAVFLYRQAADADRPSR